MSADCAVVDLPGLEQPDQERTRHVQRICGLLGRQLGLRGDDGHAFSMREAVKHLRERGQRGPWHLHLAGLHAEVQSDRAFRAESGVECP